MVIDPDTRALTSSVRDILEHGREVLGQQLKAEFMQSQVEVGSVICQDIHEARADLTRLRRTVSRIAEEHGKVIAAAATHPFSGWRDHAITPDERYEDLHTDMHDVARRLLIFNSYEEYDRFVTRLGKAGSLGRMGADPTKLWWDARPNPRIGTLEIRVPDICTTVDEAMCIAALIQSLAAKLLKLRANNQSWRLYRSELLMDNKWRAAPYGIEGTLVDFGAQEAKTIPALWAELLEFIDDVVPELGTRREVEYVQTILKNGTSADRQLSAYRRALESGCNEEQALVKVTDMLIVETGQGI